MSAAINTHRCEERRLRDRLKELADDAGPVQLGAVVESTGEKMELSDWFVRQSYLRALRERDAGKQLPATKEDDDRE